MTDLTTAARCRDLAKEILNEDEGDAVDAGTLLLLSLSVGPDLEALAGLSGIAPDFVRTVGIRLAANGTWGSDGMIHANWSDGETGIVEFLCDVNVALGFMERVEAGNDD